MQLIREMHHISAYYKLEHAWSHTCYIQRGPPQEVVESTNKTFFRLVVSTRKNYLSTDQPFTNTREIFQSFQTTSQISGTLVYHLATVDPSPSYSW